MIQKIYNSYILLNFQQWCVLWLFYSCDSPHKNKDRSDYFLYSGNKYTFPGIVQMYSKPTNTDLKTKRKYIWKYDAAINHEFSLILKKYSLDKVKMTIRF